MLVFPSNPNSGDVFAPGPGFPSWIWDGDKWTRRGIAAQFALEALSDVAISDLTQGEVLTWDATAEKWTNIVLPEVDLAAYATKQFVSDQIAAIPPTPIPSLVGLSDTNVPNPSVGQALVFNGSTWSASTTFASPIAVSSAARGILFYARDASTANEFMVDNNSPDFVRLNVNNAGSGMILATQGVTRALIDNNGRMTINPFNSATTVPLVVNNTAEGNWTAQFFNTASSSYGVYIKAASESSGSPIGAAFSVVNNLNANIFAVFGNGAINMGPAYLDTGGGSWIRTPVTIDWMGNVTIGMSESQATNPARCVINENKPGGNALIVYNSGSAWNSQFINSNTAGSSYGIIIQAGLSTNDWALQVARRAGGLMLGVRGDGNVNVGMASQSAYATGAIDAGGWIYRATSLRKNKTNIRDITLERASEVVRGLRAIQFNSLCEVDDPRRDCYGLIAEEVEEVDPTLVSYAADGKPASVMYDRVAMLLLPIVQKLLEERQC